jgi:hypothetical protein
MRMAANVAKLVSAICFCGGILALVLYVIGLFYSPLGWWVR